MKRPLPAASTHSSPTSSPLAVEISPTTTTAESPTANGEDHPAKRHQQDTLNPTPLPIQPGTPSNDKSHSIPPQTHKATTKVQERLLTLANADLVAQHYNARPELGRQARSKSPILGLKSFNNLIKKFLIQDCNPVPNQTHVLELACGKGGDLNKWQEVKVASLFGLDIAQVSVEQARARHSLLCSRLGGKKDDEGRAINATYAASDCFGTPITPLLEGKPDFDIVSVQFALHYAFCSEETVRMALSNISAKLKPGGRLIATVANANWLVKRLRSEPEGSLSFGNSIYRVTFDSRTDLRAIGMQYVFYLKDAIDDCPEFCFHFATFERLAKEVGLKLVFKKSFHDYFYEKVTQDEAAERHAIRCGIFWMKDQNGESCISPEEWEAVNIYLAFMMVKEE